MTVKQLINKLKKYPEDAKIIINNYYSVNEGLYYATSIDYNDSDNVVEIESDYKKMLE